MDKADSVVLKGFEFTLRTCLNEPEFVKNFNRLTGCALGVDNRIPIEKMIDETTGYQKELDKKQQEYMHQFAVFVWQYIFIPTVKDIIKEVKKEKGNG